MAEISAQPQSPLLLKQAALELTCPAQSTSAKFSKHLRQLADRLRQRTENSKARFVSSFYFPYLESDVSDVRHISLSVNWGLDFLGLRKRKLVGQKTGGRPLADPFRGRLYFFPQLFLVSQTSQNCIRQRKAVPSTFSLSEERHGQKVGQVKIAPSPGLRQYCHGASSPGLLIRSLPQDQQDKVRSDFLAGRERRQRFSNLAALIGSEAVPPLATEQWEEAPRR